MGLNMSEWDCICRTWNNDECPSSQCDTCVLVTVIPYRDDMIQKKQHSIFIKLASKEIGSELIPALLQLKEQSDFERASTSRVVQYILDEQLFQPRTVCVILLDILFLTFIVVFFIISSNKFFAFPDYEQLKLTSEIDIQPNITNWELCHNNNNNNNDNDNGTLLLDYLDCEYYRYSQCMILNNNNNNNNNNNGSATDEEEEYETCYFHDYDNVCNGLHMVKGYSKLCNKRLGIYFNCSSGYELLPTTEPPPPPSSSTTTTPDIGTITYSCIDRFDRMAFISRLGLGMVGMSATYFLLRHFCVLYKVPMKILIDHFGIWTLNDILSVGFALAIQIVFVVNSNVLPYYILQEQIDSFYVATNEDIDLTKLRSFSAVTAGLLFLKVMGFFTVLNRYLATFVFALGVIAVDIFWFIWIMLLMIISFAQMFYTINNGSNCSPSESLDANGGYETKDPFCRVDTSYLATYNIILGQFQMDWFTTRFSVFLFVLYTFTVVIIITNFLIAIISDSYDKSMTQVARYFGLARIMFIVEVMAFLSTFDGSAKRKSSSSEVDPENEKRCCCGFCCCKRRCCRCFLRWNLLIWSFLISLSYFIDGNWGDGIIWAAVFLLSIAWIYDPRQRLSRWCRSCFRKFVFENPVYKWVGKLLLYLFSFILGRSSDINESSFSSDNKKVQ